MGSAHAVFFFTDFHDELANAVREGRRREFAALPAFQDPAQREKIPDPNALSTFEQSKPDFDADDTLRASCLNFHRQLLKLRRELIVPHLVGCRCIGANAITAQSVIAQWQLGNGDRLTVAANFGNDPAPLDTISGDVIFSSDGDGVDASLTENVHQLAPQTARAWIEKAVTE